MKRKLGIALMLLGLLLLAGSVGLLIFNQREADRAEAVSQELLPAVSEAIAQQQPQEPQPTEPTAPPTTVPTPIYQIGDVDKDGTINIRDATTVQLFIAKYVAEIDLQLADFDGSGVVDIRDATAIQMRVAGLI